MIKWLKDAKGIIVAGGNSRRNGLTQLFYSRKVIVDQLGEIFMSVIVYGSGRLQTYSDKIFSLLI